MNGSDLARQLLRARPGLRVLFLSGYADDAVFRHGIINPASKFLQKPFTADALARKVREVLDGGDPRTTPPSP
jgi:DNA-binding NarL/FixJ family response regulator